MSKRRLNATLALLAALAATGCEPCATILGCTQSPRATIVGQLVADETGRPVTGAAVEIRYVRGVSISPTTVATTSGFDGAFELSVAADAVGDAFVTVAISQPGAQPYFIPEVRIASSRITGDATVAPKWVAARPGLPVALIVQNAQGTPYPDNVAMTFRRTSGPRLFSASGSVDSVVGSTIGGYIFLFGGVFTDTVGVVAGTLRVRYANKDTSFASSFSSTERFRVPHAIVVVPETP